VQQVQRAPWADFPDVILHTNATKLKAHPSYQAAKAGDPASAIEVADAIIRPEKIDVDFDVVVPVMQMDTGKHNANGTMSCSTANISCSGEPEDSKNKITRISLVP